MTRFFLMTLAVAIGLSAAAPALSSLARAVLPLVVALGLVLLIVRAAWYFTNRW